MSTQPASPGASAPRASADLAVLGARIRTLDPARPWATAVAVRDGVIVAVGDDAEVREACDGRTEVLDGTGLSLVPGLVDAHLHPLWSADLAVGADASGIVEVEELRALLRRERDRVGPGAVVRAWSVDYALFAGERMDGRVLEELADGPAFVIMFDLHTYLATPSVLALVGITGPEEFGEASEVVVRDGRPTGELREFPAFFRVADALPGMTRADRLDRVAALLGELNAAGLTAAHAMDGSPEAYALLRELEASGRLTLRLVVPLWVKPSLGPEVLEHYAGLAGEGGELWRGGVAKFFIDGVVETGTAWLEEPDTEGDGTRAYWPEPDRYAAEVQRFTHAGFQCATHAIGDRAVRAALDAYAAAGPARRGVHRIEHLETIPDALVRRVAAEGVAVSMQPLHMQWRAADGSDAWAQRLGPERTRRAFRTQDLLAAGAPMALGSDWPVASFDPRLGMAWARLRRAPGAPESATLEPGQRLDALATLRGLHLRPGDGRRRGGRRGPDRRGAAGGSDGPDGGSGRDRRGRAPRGGGGAHGRRRARRPPRTRRAVMTQPAAHGGAGTEGTAATTRVACCQLAPVMGDPEANRAAVEQAVRDAAARGARVVVVPELVVSGYVFDSAEEARGLAEAPDGPTVTAWAALARELDLVLVGGFAELGEDGTTLYNSAALVDPTGVRAVYRKAHLWDTEKLVFTPGDAAPPVVETAHGRIGVVVCYDLEVPEWMRLPALAGADLICAPSNWPRSPRPAGERTAEVVRAQATASVNHVWMAVCDRVGHERGVDWVGGSVIVDPEGFPVAGPPAEPEAVVLVADCDLRGARAKAISERNDVFADRRPELYGALLDPARGAS